MPTERGRDLDAAIAREVMGWDGVIWVGRLKNGPRNEMFATKPPLLDGLKYSREPSEFGVRFALDGTRYYCGEPETLYRVPRYSTDANAARLVLAEVERRGLIDKYVEELYGLVGADLAIADFTSRELYRFLTASPEAICLAALEVVRGGKG